MRFAMDGMRRENVEWFKSGKRIDVNYSVDWEVIEQ